MAHLEREKKERRQGLGRTGRPRDEEARQRILLVAERLFALHGFEGTSLRDVAHQAGGSHPGVLHHFGSKRELYAAVLNRIAASLEGLFNQALQTPGDERAKVWELLNQSLEWHLSHALWTRIILRELIDNAARASSIRRWVFADTLHRMASLIATGSKNGVLREVDPLYLLMHLFGAAGYFVGGLPTIAAIAGADTEQVIDRYRAESRRYIGRLLLPPERPERPERPPERPRKRGR